MKLFTQIKAAYRNYQTKKTITRLLEDHKFGAVMDILEAQPRDNLLNLIAPQTVTHLAASFVDKCYGPVMVRLATLSDKIPCLATAFTDGLEVGATRALNRGKYSYVSYALTALNEGTRNAGRLLPVLVNNFAREVKLQPQSPRYAAMSQAFARCPGLLAALKVNPAAPVTSPTASAATIMQRIERITRGPAPMNVHYRAGRPFTSFS